MSPERAELRYPDQMGPEAKLIVLALPEESVEITFELSSQRLISIGVNSPEKALLTYQASGSLCAL